MSVQYILSSKCWPKFAALAKVVILAPILNEKIIFL
jgi:hypothetical protein